MRKGNLLRSSKLVKSTTFTILFLVVVTIISSSSLSVTLSNISNNKKSNLEVIEEETSISVELSTGLAPIIAVENPNMPIVSFGEWMYGYIANSSVFDEGTCCFDVDNPGDITYLHDTESDDFLSGYTGYFGVKWIACEHSSGALWEIDPETGDMTYIGGGGVGLNGLATDWETGNLFGASGSDLYLVDPEDGSQELIGSFGSGVNEMIAMTCTPDVTLYGWDLGDKLWYIDKSTGEASEIGPLGIDINYAQDGGYSPETETLYLTAFTLSPYYGSYLYTCNMETGECTLVGQLEGNSQITASEIFLGCCPPPGRDVGVKNIKSPNDGNAGEDMEVIVQVKNFGSLSDYVDVNVVILKDGINEEYNETVYDIYIEKDGIVDVEMPVWTPDDWQSAYNEYIDYKITACTKLYFDENPNNDYKEKWFELYFGYFHDVGCTNVIGPESGPAQIFKVNATIKNLGQYDECCFKTYIEIAELDNENTVELSTEDFSDPTFPPNGWIKTHENWKYSNSNYTGGSSGEARFYNSLESTDNFRLYTPTIDTSDYSAVEIEFKHYVDHNTTPYTLQVETSDDKINWDVVWNINPTSDIGPETINILTAKNVGSNTYVSWTFNGNSSNIDNWYIDEIVINGYTSFSPEYEDYHCTTTIEPGKENELEFDDWTPDYLQYETTGTKKYIVKAWTDMNDPQDENPDNDLFIKTIILEYFHDVAIQVASPINEEGPDLIWDNGYTIGNNGYIWGQTGAEVYVPIGEQDIDALASNIGTFPERDMTCYAEINEFYTDCENETLVYKDNITDIDILKPLIGTKLLNFKNYDFAVEGLYRLYLNLVDDNDDYPGNNQLTLSIGCDAAPPITTHVLNPATPDGLNGWYISPVTVTLISADPSIGCDVEGSGVKEIKYTVDGGTDNTIPGTQVTFVVTTDSTMHTIKYWAIDNVGNIESQKTINFKQDQTQPEIDFTYEWSGNKPSYTFTFTAYATDATSGMQRVEIYYNSELQKTIIGPGPEYVWKITLVRPGIYRAVAYDFAGLSAYDDVIDPRTLDKNSASQSINTNNQHNMRLPLSK